MAYKRKKRFIGSNKYYSIVNKFRREGRSTEEFEMMLQSFNLEEIIGLKLELAANAVGGKLFGFDLYKRIPIIARDAILKYAFSCGHTNVEKANFLGIDLQNLDKLRKRHKIESFFEKEDD